MGFLGETGQLSTNLLLCLPGHAANYTSQPPWQLDMVMWLSCSQCSWQAWYFMTLIPLDRITRQPSKGLCWSQWTHRMEGAWVPGSLLGRESLADENTCFGFYVSEKQIGIVFETLHTYAVVQSSVYNTESSGESISQQNHLFPSKTNTSSEDKISSQQVQTFSHIYINRSAWSKSMSRGGIHSYLFYCCGDNKYNRYSFLGNNPAISDNGWKAVTCDLGECPVFMGNIQGC